MFMKWLSRYPEGHPVRDLRWRRTVAEYEAAGREDDLDVLLADCAALDEVVARARHAQQRYDAQVSAARRGLRKAG